MAIAKYCFVAKHRSQYEGKALRWVHKTELLSVIDPSSAPSQTVILTSYLFPLKSVEILS